MTVIISDNVGRTSGLIKAASGGGGVWTKIKTLTASADATLDFVDGSDDVTLDSTYPIYLFKFINIHPATDGANFQFQGNASGGSGFNETITSTLFDAWSKEDGSNSSMAYNSNDLAQETVFQRLTDTGGNGNDECCSGYLQLFNPSDTTFVKHFISVANTYYSDDFTVQTFGAGYFNTTSAIDEIQFKFTSGNTDAGKIKLYGLGDS